MIVSPLTKILVENSRSTLLSGISFFLVLFGNFHPSPHSQIQPLNIWIRFDILCDLCSCVCTCEWNTALPDSRVAYGTFLFVESQYNGLMISPTRVVHSIVCCRILLNLKQAAAWYSASTELPHSLVFASPPAQQTSQQGSAQLEAYEPHRRELDDGGVVTE